MIVAIETFTRESTEDNFISENLTKLIYNNWLLIAETDANGSVTREYFYSDDANGDAGVGKLIRFIDYTDKTGGLLSAESKNYFVINDNVGNITSVIDKQGNIINSYAYSPFGELIVEQEQVKLNIGFNTKYEDESGLIYYNHRYYDSDLGRFISQDPIFEEGGINLYNFVENDPINHWDILGNISINYGTLTLEGNLSFVNFTNRGVTYDWNNNPTFMDTMLLRVVEARIHFGVDITATVGINCSTTHNGETIDAKGNYTGIIRDYRAYIPLDLGPAAILPTGFGQYLTALRVTNLIANLPSNVTTYIINASAIITSTIAIVRGAEALCAASLQNMIDNLEERSREEGCLGGEIGNGCERTLILSL